VIPDIINPLPFPQSNQHNSSLQELPQVFKVTSNDNFPPSMSSTISGLDLIPTKNNQPPNIEPEQPPRVRRASTPSLFSSLRVASVPKQSSPGINGNVSPIEVFPRLFLKPNPTSQAKLTDKTPDLGIPELDIGDLGEISTLHINLNGRCRSDEICCTKNIDLAGIDQNDSSRLMGSVFIESAEKNDLLGHRSSKKVQTRCECGKKRLLIVDDEVMNLKVIELGLKNFEFQ
jgi:hypothetical protein